MAKKVIISLLIGRKGSRGFPKKNLLKISNKFIFEYPILACSKSRVVDDIYISTDCPKIIHITKKKI